VTRIPRQVMADPKSRHGSAVAEMFGAIASTYDFLNHLLSLNMDRHWRAVAVKALESKSSDIVLDLCTGTGDLAFALMKRSGCRLVGADFSRPMLDIARNKGRKMGRPFPLAQADALALPFRTAAFDSAMVAFGIRNFENLDMGLSEAARVLKPGGTLAILEFSSPRGSLFAVLYGFYFHEVLPRVGRIVSGAWGPYAYLPATVEDFPDAPSLALRLGTAGLSVHSQRPLTGGIATLHLCRRDRASGTMVP
jgi:demethylmenaquinone methyltransferase / 2-methoxy-6-polyprenyl-1,4-benzoquinol methylase